MSTAAIEAGSDGTWRVSGSLLMQTVPTVLETSRSLPTPASRIVDLQGVDRIDSSAVALLLEWLRLAARRGEQLRYRNVPQELLSIARLCGVETLLPLTDTAQ